MPCRLPFDLPEDPAELLKIGKLRFHKSGKVVLRIQNPSGEKIDLVVNKGITNSFYQELVQIQTNEETKQNSLSFLGQVQDKLVVTPDIDSMLKE